MGARIPAAKAPYTGEVQRWLGRVMPPGRAPLALFTTMARDERLFQLCVARVPAPARRP